MKGYDSFAIRCYQSIKDKNFESNSQLRLSILLLATAVISLSKIKISKAIHNDRKLMIKK